MRNPARVGEVRIPPPACYNYRCGEGISALWIKQEGYGEKKHMDRQGYGRGERAYSDDDLQYSDPWPTVYPEAQWYCTRHRK